MKLKLYPILAEMKAFYQQPLGPGRFNQYIEKLQAGSKGDMKLPIGSFNPMAKNHVLLKLEELEALDAESIMREAKDAFNQENEIKNSPEITILFNLADDLQGGWTHRYATDFDSKFKINAIAERGFCTPFFWSSESYTADLVRIRTMEYAYRTMFWLENGRVKTLEDHVKQEIFVSKMTAKVRKHDSIKNTEDIAAFYQANKTSDDYSLIFNFFYGDAISKLLEYPLFGNEKSAGFSYAAQLALETN